MKKAILITLFSLPLFSFGQDYSIDTLNNLVKFQKIYEVNGTKDELFNKASNWVASNFKSSKFVIDLSDKDNGQLFLRSNFKVYTGIWINSKMDSIYTIVDYECKFFIKDKKYKLITTNLLVHNAPLGKETLTIDDEHIRKYLQEVLQQSSIYMQALFEDVNKYIKAKSENDF